MNTTKNHKDTKSHFKGTQANENGAGNIWTPSSMTERLRQALNRIQGVLESLLDLTKSEIAKTDSRERTALWGELPSDYALKLGAGLLKMRNQLYAYFQHNWYDPLQLRQERCKGKLAMPPELYDAVKLHVTDAAVYVYLPYLPEKKDRKEDLIYDLLFSRLLEEPRLPRWTQHRISFHHVFPKETFRMPRDVDNYYYKRTIDLIETAMRQSDSALCCSLEMAAHFTDIIPSGVYIEVSPKSSEIPENVISYFSRFSQNRII